MLRNRLALNLISEESILVVDLAAQNDEQKLFGEHISTRVWSSPPR